jgi:predicted amidohydrolase
MVSKTIRVSGLQMLVSRDVAQNEKRILRAVELAADQESDFLLTPEGALSGYHADFDGQEVASAVARVADQARKAGVGLALGTCYKELEDGVEYCYNQVRVYTPNGDYLGSYAKILRCSSLSHPGTGEMTEYVEGMLRTFDWKGVRFSVLICNDLWATPGYTVIPNPYLPWKLKQLGAQVLFHAVNSGHHQRNRAFHESSVDLWAYALRMPIVEVNALEDSDKPINASSGLVGPDGTRTLVVPDTGERFFTCDITL